jgi:N-dimethylarginine dimethylaminohydrolase
VKPKAGLTELCFFGDSIFAIGKKAVFGRLACPERYHETGYVMEVMQELGFKGERVPDGLSYEGSGETLVWNDKIFVGYGLRNKKEVVEYLQKQFPDFEVIGLQLVDPYMYHLDTALFPVSNNLIAAYKRAFCSKGVDLLSKLNSEILWVDEEDVNNFALNSVALGENIVVHRTATKFINNLE